MALPQISRTTKIILMAEFIFLAYMLYILSTSLYKSYQVDRFIQSVAEENQKIESANSQLVEEYEYYTSDAYKEKIAKQNFGLVRPGEEVIVLAPNTGAYLTGEERASQVSKEYYYGLSNPHKWFLFFFDREKFAL